jgi:uncharacterized membrane-anchored protein
VRSLVLWVVLALTLVAANLAIAGKERTLSEGETVLLELVPVDPRSILQGDYMALRYALAREVGRELSDQLSANGRVVVTLDANGVANFVRFDDGSDAAAGEQFLRYRKRGEGVRIATDAFFFQEGQGPAYRNARFGELRVDARGNSVLVGLRDGEFMRLGADQISPTVR